jgi:hypothetical protein
MNKLGKLAFAAAMGAGALAMTATSASAYIVCNARNVCWHTHARYAYRPAFGLVVHPDSWRWRRRDHYVFRDHPGRGYWRNGVWITF